MLNAYFTPRTVPDSRNITVNEENIASFLVGVTVQPRGSKTSVYIKFTQGACLKQDSGADCRLPESEYSRTGPRGIL